jgi:hypothetical protein
MYGNGYITKENTCFLFLNVQDVAMKIVIFTGSLFAKIVYVNVGVVVLWFTQMLRSVELFQRIKRF